MCNQTLLSIACPIHKLRAHIFHGAAVRSWRGATKSDMQRASKSISVSQSPTASKNLSNSTLGTSRCLSFKRLLMFTGLNTAWFQLVQGTLNVDAGCIVPAIAVHVQQRLHSEACQRAWTSWFLVCRRCPLPTKRSVSSFSSGDSHWSVSSFLIRLCLLLSMGSERVGFLQPQLSKSFLACGTARSRVRRM